MSVNLPSVPPFPFRSPTYIYKYITDARVLDKRVRAAWQSHPQFTVIDNHTDFQGKLQRTADSILKNAGAYFGVPYSSSASSSLSNGSNDKLAPPPSSSSAVEVDGHGPQVALS